MIPLSVIDLLVHGESFGGARAHVQQQVEMAVQHLDGKEVNLERDGALVLLLLLLLLGLAVAEEEQAIRLSGAEVERDGAGLLCRPLVERDKGLGGLEGDGVQRGHALTLEGHRATHLHLGVTLLGKPRELQPYVIVLVHNLLVHMASKQRRKKG